MKKQLVTLNINGEDMDLKIAPTDVLADVLRKEAGLTGTERRAAARVTAVHVL